MRNKFMIAKIILFCTVILTVAILVSCTSPDNDNISETTNIQEQEGKYLGTLNLEESSDGKTVNISYVYNGRNFSYTVPNNANYLSGGFSATDDVGRTLPNSMTTGIYGKTGEHYVGIFYFLWQGEHGDGGIYDLQKIIDKYGDLAQNANAIDPETGKNIYGKVGDMHWFAEPLYGYYYASDTWVLRKHMELLTNANIDFLYFDVTNGYIYKDNALKVMKICHELNNQGYDAPQVVFYTNSKSEQVMKKIYDEIYSKNLYPDTWFYVDGKPCIVGVESGNVNNFFTVKAPQWPNEITKNNSWPWMDFEWPQRIYTDAMGNPSAISVSIAQHNGNINFSTSSLYGSSSNRGRSFNNGYASMKEYRAAYDANNLLTMLGLNFQAQWDRAIKANVPYVLVTGWNEWVAQRQSKYGNQVSFIDTASMEFSRDAEMMRGGYFDNYYMQLILNIQRLKGSAPIIVQDARIPISLDGGFDQWNDVKLTYKDFRGDTKDRYSQSFGENILQDESGKNDIVAAKVTQDSKNIYFYVRTSSKVTKATSDDAWMQLFVNVNKKSTDGWYGYDYLINASAKSEELTTVAACSSNNGVLKLTEVGEISYKKDGNEMMIAVPFSMLGIYDPDEVYIEFKWADADSKKKYNTMEDFYLYGDIAPLGRLNWIYQNYIPGYNK